MPLTTLELRADSPVYDPVKEAKKAADAAEAVARTTPLTQPFRKPAASVQDTLPDGFDLDEQLWADAIDLLNRAAEMLGFFGDREMSKKITSIDRKRMMIVADDVYKFLQMVEELSASTVDISNFTAVTGA